jgi:hypothetical protein
MVTVTVPEKPFWPSMDTCTVWPVPAFGSVTLVGEMDNVKLGGNGGVPLVPELLPPHPMTNIWQKRKVVMRTNFQNFISRTLCCHARYRTV